MSALGGIGTPEMVVWGRGWWEEDPQERVIEHVEERAERALDRTRLWGRVGGR